MSRFRAALACLALLGLGCADDPSSPGPGAVPAASTFCQAYADRCGKGFDVAKCLSTCVSNEALQSDKCYFAACGVEVSKCDNEEDGDASILACAERHGWRKALTAPATFCDAYAKQCPAKAGDVTKCKADCEVGGKMTSDKCYFPACGVEVGKCDNEEDGDASILACAERHGWR